MKCILCPCLQWMHQNELELTEYIANEQQFVTDYLPGKGAWTYHLKLPETKDLKGKWGDIKVMGTIDGFDIGCKNLMPKKGGK